MKQTSEPGVQPRRNLLAALWVSLVGLVASSKLLAAEPDEDQKKMHQHPVSNLCRVAPSRDPELTDIIGRLCLDQEFRDEFFASHEVDANALKALQKRKLNVTRPDVTDNLNKILKAHKGATTDTNPVQTACASVNNLLSSISVSCPDWPC